MCCVFLLCGQSISVHMYACECTYIMVVRLHPCMCVRWGQQNVTTSWWGTALLLTKEASGCESVPTEQTCGRGISSAALVPR